MKKYDVLIIGSGLGGLVCGYILSREGFSVCVTEKNPIFGGCLQSFKREGCVFDTGVHYIGSMEKGQILNKYFTYLGIAEKLNLKKMDEKAVDVIAFESDKKHYKLASSEENFVEQLACEFPGEKENIKAYYKRLIEISESLNLISLKNSDEQDYNPLKYLSEGAFDFISSFTSNRRLQSVLAGNNPVYAGKKEHTPLLTHAVITYFFISGAWRLADGSQQIADLLVSGIVSNGGTVLKNYELMKLSESEGKISCAEFSNGERLEAKWFISGIAPASTLNLIEGKVMKKAYINRIKGLKNTISPFSINVVLKKSRFPYLNSNYFYYSDDNVWNTSEYDELSWPKGFMFLTSSSKKSSSYAESFTAMTYMNFSDVEKWATTAVGKRGEEYEDFKNKTASKLISRVERLFPGIKNEIKSVYSASPLTYRDYTGTINGSLYGIERSYKDPFSSLIFPVTKIPNLLLTGQNINMHGVLGVTVGAVLTCSRLLGLNYLIERINSAQ